VRRHVRMNPIKAQLKRVMVHVVFSGDLEPDPCGAADELRELGYDVHFLPSKYRRAIARSPDNHPLDDFLEAIKDAPGNRDTIVAAMEEVGEIVDQFGGAAIEGDAVDENYAPFSDGRFVE
jgi:hypothetical protein